MSSASISISTRLALPGLDLQRHDALDSKCFFRGVVGLQLTWSQHAEGFNSLEANMLIGLQLT